MYNEICGKLIVAGGTLLNMLQKILRSFNTATYDRYIVNHSLCNTTSYFPSLSSGGFSHMILF